MKLYFIDWIGAWRLACYNMDGLKDTIGGDYKNKYITIALWALVLIFSAAQWSIGP